MKAKVIAVVNQKGGVGKTTTVINLASSFVTKQKKVLIIDSDSQGGSTMGLGVEISHDKCNIYNTNGVNINDLINKTQHGIDLIPSNSNLIGTEIILLNSVKRESKLKENMIYLLDKYDYILIDCPPSVGLMTINALVASTSTIVPTSCEYYAMCGLGQIFNTIKIIQNRLNPYLIVDGLLITSFNNSSEVETVIKKEIEKSFDGIIFKTNIPRDINFSKSSYKSIPINLINDKTIGAVAYDNLAKELLTVDE